MTKFTSLLFFVSILHFSCITEQLRESAYLKIKEDKVKLSYQIPERGYMKFVLEPSQVGIENKDVMVKVTNEVDEFLVPIHTNFDMNKIFEIEFNSVNDNIKMLNGKALKLIEETQPRFDDFVNYQIKKPIFYLQIQDRIGNILLDKVAFNYKTKDESAFIEEQKVYLKKACNYSSEYYESKKNKSQEEIHNQSRNFKEGFYKHFKKSNIPNEKIDLAYKKILIFWDNFDSIYCDKKLFGYEIPKE